MLERTALRLATVALLANGFNAPFPTMAGARVYDSRTTDVQVASGEELVPVVQVCTDDDTGAQLSTNNGGPPFEHTVTLSVDISVLAPSDDGQNLGYPETDAELEVMLDVFEAQVLRLIAERPGRWGQHFDNLARRITNWSSMRYVVRDGNARIVARQIQMQVMLPVDNGLAQITVTSMPDPVTIPAPLGPLLADLIALAPVYAADAQSIQTQVLNNGVVQPTVLPPLDTVRFVEKAQAEENNAGTPRGPRPDGVAEVTFPTD